MKEINCNIIRDLLPLYEDGAVSEDTAQLVREHLEGCSACREEYERMHTPTPVPPDRDISMILQMEDEMRKKSIRRVFCGVGVFVVLACLFCLWYTWPVPYEDLVPEGAECQEIVLSADYFLEGDTDFNTQREDYHTTLTPEDPVFGQLLSLVEGQSFRRTLKHNLFQTGGFAWSPDAGDISWNVRFYYDVPQEDGTVRRKRVEIDGTKANGGEPFGDTWVQIVTEVTVETQDGDILSGEEFDYWYATVDDQQQWIADVMDVIRQLPSESVS